MIVIELTQNRVARVDTEDADLRERRWFAVKARQSWYARRHSNVAMHRVVMERKLGRALKPGEFVDHINRDGLDNRRSNLRVADRYGNARNATKPFNRTGYKGVREQRGKYVAQITVNYRVMHIGTFDTPEQAHSAYCEAARKYHGEFANFGDKEQSA